MQAINIQIPIELIEQSETVVLEKIAIQLYENNIKKYIYLWASPSVVELFRVGIPKPVGRKSYCPAIRSR